MFLFCSPAELNSVSKADMPYILKIELTSRKSDKPGRSVYLLTANFTEKDMWDSTLEAIVNSGNMDKGETESVSLIL